MALADVLRARAAAQGRAALIECGELGRLTVESLPVRELELLLRGEDSYRAVFYAACRDLQLAGELLLREGKVYAPDGILQFVSDAEAAEAARTVFDLSGWSEKTGEEAETEAAAAGKTTIKMHGASAVEPAVETEETFAEKTEAAGQKMPAEAKPADVEAMADSTDMPAAKHFVRTMPQSEEAEVRQEALLTKNVMEQAVPHEIKTRKNREGKMPKPAEAAANGEKTSAGAGQWLAAERGAVRAKESPFLETLLPAAERMHGGSAVVENNVMQSAEARKTEVRETVQETVWRRETVHEEETALAERVARRLLEGLRRANLVKGD